ncbi:MAG: GNAT family N-acetyltransferase [Acidobacteria bacterium]|nr:GNAT family N-acetyltransferase [Acidobacteriota bacterium]
MDSADSAGTRQTTDDVAGVRVRAARAADGAFILPLVPRLAEFGPPPWRDEAVMTAAESGVIAEALRAPASDEAIFVAEDDDAQPLGFIHLVTATDYFTRAPHGHVSALVVAPAGEGRGVGRALMGAGEEWARARGYPLLTLNVFARNSNAIKFYGRLGYGADTLKYAKEL